VKRDLAVLIAVLVVVTALAELFGATNFGTAATFGEIAFAAALLWILLKRP
jgi:hypothetical protein